MSFPARLAIVCSVLALLVAAFVLGLVFSPQRMEERRSGAPLLPLPSSVQVSSVDVYSHADDAAPLVTLQRKGANLWDAAAGSATYPASSDRAAALLQELLGLRRGNLVSTDPSRMADLGLDPASAHRVVLHAPGRPDVALLVGKRAPSGDEEYVQLQGERAAFLTRSSLGVLLSQDRSYWYDLRVLPEDVQPTTIMSVAVTGSSVGEPFTLVRVPAGQGYQWQLQGRGAPVNQTAAVAMIERLAQLEGTDFAQGATASGAATLLQVTVVALNGDRYILRIRRGSQNRDQLFLTTSWSPWTYAIDSSTLSRTIFSASDLLAGH